MNFKVIDDYPNYKISSCGKIFNRKREKKQTCDKCRYKQIQLCKNGKVKMFKVHRLVGKAFIPNPNNLPQIDHINNIRDDNRVENLQWITNIDNNQKKGNYKNNTSGHKNISWNKSSNYWQFEKRIDSKRYTKHSKDLNVLIEYKKQFDNSSYI